MPIITKLFEKTQLSLTCSAREKKTVSFKIYMILGNNYQYFSSNLEISSNSFSSVGQSFLLIGSRIENEDIECFLHCWVKPYELMMGAKLNILYKNV